jgi:hypothetical protein
MEVIQQKTIECRPSETPEAKQRRGRSRVTNGKVLIAGVDQRSPWVRRCKDVIASHISDLGGADNCSAAERSIVRRASVLTVELEQLEVKFATAGQADAGDLETYQRCANSLRRLLEAVGMSRRPRHIGSSVSDYLRSQPPDWTPLRARSSEAEIIDVEAVKK